MITLVIDPLLIPLLIFTLGWLVKVDRTATRVEQEVKDLKARLKEKKVI
ncbi:MAG: hypothetical protein QW688_07330 [Thermoprotei archaeon]